MRELNLVVIDTETGGLDPAKHCIIELAAAHVTIEGVCIATHDRFHSRVFPDRPVDPGAAAINGYTPEAWAVDALYPVQVARGFLDWLSGIPVFDLIWTGSNVTGFDLPFLRSDFARVDLALPGKPKFTHRTLNTESLCFPLYARGETEGCGIRHLRKWAGLDGEQSHRAMGDVNDTIAVIGAYFERKVYA